MSFLNRRTRDQKPAAGMAGWCVCDSLLQEDDSGLPGRRKVSPTIFAA